MKKPKLKNWIVFIAFISAAFYFSDLLNVFLKKETTEQKLIAVANEINKKLPVMVDDTTRLNQVKSDGKMLSYKYTVTNIRVTEMSKENVDEFKEQMYVILKNGICNSKIASVLNDGASFKYIYYDTKDVEIASLSISRADCDVSP